MAILGTHLTVLIGATIPTPAPAALMESLASVEVTQHDQGRSGFQLTFQAGRSGPAERRDYPLLVGALLRPFNRIQLLVDFGGAPSVLMDGFITHQQHAPANDPGATRVTVTGEDVSVIMDLHQKRRPWTAMAEQAIVTAILGEYRRLGLVPDVKSPSASDTPAATRRIPMQIGTDLVHLQMLARRYAFVFYVEAGPAPGVNTAYWGPPKRAGRSQRALSVNLGPETNVDSVSFAYNALAPTSASLRVQDSQSGSAQDYKVIQSEREPLSARPALSANQPNVRSVILGIQHPGELGGLTLTQASARAQARVDASTDSVVSAQGTLDALRYGGLLKPRGRVDLRGVGDTYDGSYYVRSVTHSIAKGNYKQSFSLTREGIGALSPVVVP